MPVLIWEERGSVLSSHVETTRADSLGGEGFREAARALDYTIDGMLDHAMSLAAPGERMNTRQREFIHRWAIGRALKESGLMESEHLDAEDRKSLWLAIARKCRIGVRADGSREQQWRSLIPQRANDPQRIERDVFAIGLWLQEQELDQAMMTFGAKFHNARRLHGRIAINSKQVRDALARWFETLSPALHSAFTSRENFEQLAKALAKRFPARGPGSAKRPVHYADDALYAEILAVLEPLAEELAPAALSSLPLSP